MSPHRAVPTRRSKSPARSHTQRTPQTTELHRPAADEIERACAALLYRIPPEFREMAEPEFRRHIDWVQRACSHAAAESCENGAVASLRRRLVDVLRSELLSIWVEDTPDPGTMLDTLLRLDYAQTSSVYSGERAFAMELADAGGANLMVEVAHDMRSPLTSIVFLSEVLHRGQSGVLSPLQRRQVGIVYSAALGLVNMVSDLIEMTRNGGSSTSGPPSAFAVNAILNSVQDLVQPLVEEKGLTFQLEPLANDRRIGHPVPLTRILLNLTTNALKFTHEGSVTLSAHSVGGSCVQFSVTDTGPGIPEEATATLYQPFRHEPRRSTGYAFSGTGLGLAICRRLVAELGSQLLVETCSDGTRFTFDVELPPASKV